MAYQRNRANYYSITPFTFDENNLVLGDPKQEDVKVNEQIIQRYNIKVEYIYPDGSKKDLSVKFPDLLPYRLFLNDRRAEIKVVENEAIKTYVHNVSKGRGALLVVFDPAKIKHPIKKSKLYPDYEGDEMMSPEQIVDAILDFFYRLRVKIAETIHKHFSAQFRKKNKEPTVEDLMDEVSTSSFPDHPKNKDKIIMIDKPMQMYFQLKAFSYLKDKKDLKSLEDVITNVRLVNEPRDETLKKRSRQWTTYENKILNGVLIYNFNNVSFMSKKWSLKGDAQTFMVVSAQKIERTIEKQEQEIEQEYVDDPNAKLSCASIIDEIREEHKNASVKRARETEEAKREISAYNPPMDAGDESDEGEDVVDCANMREINPEEDDD